MNDYIAEARSDFTTWDRRKIQEQAETRGAR